MKSQKGQERSLQHMQGEKKETEPLLIKQIHSNGLYFCTANIAAVHQSVGGLKRLTVIWDQALARSEKQVNFAASCLDQLNRSSVRNTMRGLAVDLHNLISNLRTKRSLFVNSFKKCGERCEATTCQYCTLLY